MDCLEYIFVMDQYTGFQAESNQIYQKCRGFHRNLVILYIDCYFTLLIIYS